MTKQADIEKAAARESLAFLRPGDRIYCVLRHRAASGMFRVIQLVTFPGGRTNGRPFHLGYNVAALLGERYDLDREGIGVSGAGMDMGFHLVYSLGAALWPNGYRCSGKKRGCHSSAHVNGPHYEPDGRMRHRDGGYALESVWL